VAAFGRASVVLVDFPFSDLSDSKLRPAVVLAQANRQDWFLCQITSNAGIDERAIEINDPDFVVGSLRQRSFARPNKIFTGHERLINRRVGILSDGATGKITDAVIAILRQK
jgi:PemK-like, MazF-like toxin of type II toxin-antitoxin system